MVASAKQCQQCCGNGRCARCSGNRADTPFQSRQTFFQNIASWIVKARINKSGFRKIEQVCSVVAIFKNVAGSLVNWHRSGSSVGGYIVSCVQQLCCEIVLCTHFSSFFELIKKLKQKPKCALRRTLIEKC